jgi:hypothetical protein
MLSTCIFVSMLIRKPHGWVQICGHAVQEHQNHTGKNNRWNSWKMCWFLLFLSTASTSSGPKCRVPSTQQCSLLLGKNGLCVPFHLSYSVVLGVPVMTRMIASHWHFQHRSTTVSYCKNHTNEEMVRRWFYFLLHDNLKARQNSVSISVSRYLAY